MRTARAKSDTDCPPVTTSSTCAARGTISVKGPGQNAFASTMACADSVAQRCAACDIADVHDQRMVGRSPLRLENPRDRVAGCLASAPKP
jgi:hypothetical protein